MGYCLNDEILEFVNKEMANVVLSIDGRETGSITKCVLSVMEKEVTS